MKADWSAGNIFGTNSWNFFTEDWSSSCCRKYSKALRLTLMLEPESPLFNNALFDLTLIFSQLATLTGCPTPVDICGGALAIKFLPISLYSFPCLLLNCFLHTFLQSQPKSSAGRKSVCTVITKRCLQVVAPLWLSHSTMNGFLQGHTIRHLRCVECSLWAFRLLLNVLHVM